MDSHRHNLSRLERALLGTSGPSSDFDLNPGSRPVPTPPHRPAAVLVPIVERGTGLGVILTRRAALLRHHPGQVAFPGGKQDPNDPTPVDAALREAEEEIGLPVAAVRVLGSLTPHETITSFCVTPVVGVVDPGFRPRAEPSEVEEVFEVPLDFLMEPDNYQIHARRWQNVERRYLTIPYGPHYIWGATARILQNLAGRMQGP